MRKKYVGIFLFQSIAIILNFLPLSLSPILIQSVAKYWPTSFLAYYLQASVVIFIPMVLDLFCEIFGCYGGQSKITNIIVLACVMLPNTLLLLLLSNMQSSFKLSQICMTLFFFHTMTTISGIFIFSSKFFKIASTSTLSAAIVPILSIAVGLNSLSHADLGPNIDIIILSSSFLFSCLGVSGIFKSYQIIYTRRRTIDPINFHCFAACMTSLLLLVIGLIILRFISLLSSDGMIVYVNGIPLLCTICVLPILMLEGRVMRHKAVRNEVSCSYRYCTLSTNNLHPIILQALLLSKKAFFRSTSHEIRTPMNTIFMGCQMLKKQLQEVGVSNKEAYDILEDIRVASDITIQLVSDLLTQDKLEEGTMQLDKAPTQIWTLVKDTLRPFIRQVSITSFYNNIQYLLTIRWCIGLYF